jgi:hypothetical protein
MIIPFALFIALHFFAGQEISGPQITAQPKTVTVKDLLHKLSTSDAMVLLGREHLLDSSVSFMTDPSMKWHERFLDSTLGRHKITPVTFTQMAFAPVIFEGISAKVTILFGEDSSFGATVSIPYPHKLRSGATVEDFDKLRVSIAKSIGEPTVSTEMYIDYMVSGTESLFGNLKDGVITITIWRLGN